MLELTFKEIKPDYFIIRGDKIDSKIQRLAHYSPDTKVQAFRLNEQLQKTTDAILTLPDDVLVYAIGNQVGEGQEILQKLSNFKYNG